MRYGCRAGEQGKKPVTRPSSCQPRRQLVLGGRKPQNQLENGCRIQAEASCSDFITTTSRQPDGFDVRFQTLTEQFFTLSGDILHPKMDCE